jgi:hypothetical protein
MKRIIAVSILLFSISLLTNCASTPLLNYRNEFPRAIYTYDKLYNATLLYLNSIGKNIISTEKSVGLIHLTGEDILLTQTNDTIIFTRSYRDPCPEAAYAYDYDAALKKCNDDMIDSISKQYFRLNGQ